MPAKKKRVTRKKIRYRQIKFKLTSQQKKSLDTYCAQNNTSMIHLIKKSISDYTKNHRSAPVEKDPKQLSIFDELNRQLTIFED